MFLADQDREIMLFIGKPKEDQKWFPIYMYSVISAIVYSLPFNTKIKGIDPFEGNQIAIFLSLKVCKLFATSEGKDGSLVRGLLVPS